MIGGLMYLTASRPDIAFATFVCARYQAHPTEKHLKEVKRIFRYLRQSINMGLWYSKDSGFELIAYADADHAGCNDDCKSTSGGIQFLGDKLVSWSSKKQDCTTMSSAEAEYVSLSACCAQLTDLSTKALPKERFEFLVHKIVFHMAQHVISAAQLVPQYKSIRRCNNYVVLQSIPCSPKCKIVGRILLDHPLSYALTAIADVPAVYLQQFWRTVSKVPVETPDTPFVAPTNIHTIEAFMSRVFNRCLTTRTSGHDQTKINILQLFHAVVNRTNVDYAALLWWDFINNVFKKKEAIQYPRFIKLIIADLMKKFPNIPKRLEEYYHSIKDDVHLVSVYTTGNVLIRGMLIPHAFLTTEIRETNDFKEYEMALIKVDVPMNQPQPVVSTQGTHRITPSAYRSPTISASPQETKKRKQIAEESSLSRKSLKITIKQKEIVDAETNDVDSEDRLEPESHKENPEVVDDDNDNVREKKDDTMGSMEIRNEETKTTISTPLRSPRKSLSSDKNIFQELTDTIPITTTSKHSQVKKRISSKYSHLPGALRRMCRRQGYMIQDMERKCVTTEKLWETHNKVDHVLKEVIPEIAENAVNDLIEYNLKPCIADTIIEDRDAFRSDIPAFVSQEFKTHAPKIITELFKDYVQSNVIHVHPTTISSTPTDSSADLQYQLYLKMKRSLQDRANNITLWEALRRKFEKSSTSNTSCREDDFHSHHDEHQDDDAPPKGEKRVKRSKKSKRSKSARGSSSKHSRKDSTTYVSKQQSQNHEWDAWEEENVVDEDEVIPEDVTPELIAESHNVDKRVPTIFDHARMEATLRDSLSNLSRNAEEYAYHLEQSTSFMEN
ncbi:hypothetical protein Tco_1256780 [Tanacetum coccineum]